jgi:hypothetical protein
MSKSMATKSLLLLATSAMAAISPRAADADVPRRDQCDMIICASSYWECTEQHAWTICGEFCEDYVSFECGYSSSCEPGEYAYICRTNPM